MAIALITTPPDPNALTPLAEFQSQTPESLTDSEVLHYSSPVEVAFTPAAASPFQSSFAKIYVTSKIVTLWSETDSKGLAIPYPNISLHAAQAPGSRGENSRGCIYMQLEGASHLMSESATNGNNHESPEDEDDDMAELVEVNLIPADESTLPAFYEGLCACASLHPDLLPPEDDMMFEGASWTMSSGLEDDAFEDADDEGAAEGNVTKWRRTE